MLVYRLVNKTRRGVYQPQATGLSLWRLVFGTADVGGRWPLPEEDGIHIRNVHSAYRFGFSTPKQLKNWTKSAEARRALTAAGGKINIYKVSPEAVLEGGRQVAFLGHKARLVGSFPVTHFD